jgi:hypothetical protein
LWSKCGPTPGRSGREMGNRLGHSARRSRSAARLVTPRAVGDDRTLLVKLLTTATDRSSTFSADEVLPHQRVGFDDGLLTLTELIRWTILVVFAAPEAGWRTRSEFGREAGVARRTGWAARPRPASLVVSSHPGRSFEVLPSPVAEHMRQRREPSCLVQNPLGNAGQLQEVGVLVAAATRLRSETHHPVAADRPRLRATTPPAAEDAPEVQTLH